MPCDAVELGVDAGHERSESHRLLVHAAKVVLADEVRHEIDDAWAIALRQELGHGFTCLGLAARNARSGCNSILAPLLTIHLCLIMDRTVVKGHIEGGLART